VPAFERVLHRLWRSESNLHVLGRLTIPETVVVGPASRLDRPSRALNWNQIMLRTTVLSSILLSVVPATLLAAPPTPEEIGAKAEAAMAYYRAQGDKFDIESPEFIAVLDEQLKGVDPAECGMEEIQGMVMLWLYSPNAKPAWIARIRDLGNGEQWLDAALMLAQFGEIDAALEIGSMHGFAQVPDARLGEVIEVLGQLTPEQLNPMRFELEGLAYRMSDDPAAIFGWMEYPTLLDRAGSDKAVKDAARTKIVEAMKSAAGKEDLDPRMKSRLDQSIAYLDSAAGRGELIGYTAPAIEITWNSAGESWHCFNCLRDKVVVVDFWATWCGPCVGSFPNVRELVDYYKGYDVVVLGLTSPQEKVYFRDERGVVDAPEFEKECELMADYVKAMDITWPIAMTKQNVFNPDFGVRGIPHVAIIGADGKVAYNGLHPAGDMAEKVDHINELLEKAGKKHPGPWQPKTEEPATEQG
jgi:thiol-disulfide isomerase/thioredoxin